MTDLIKRAKAIATAPKITPSCVEALESYDQADEEGIFVLASRQAIHETIDAYWSRVAENKDLARALIAAEELAEALDKWVLHKSVEDKLAAFREATKGGEG